MNDLALFENVTALAVLTDSAKFSEFYKRVKEEVTAFVPDLTTVKGRNEIAAMAYKVTRTKTAIDAAGKKLNEDARKTIDAVDASRRKIRAELDALADEVRKPLTEWEDAEKARAEQSAAIIARIHHLASLVGASSEDIRSDLAELEGIEIDGDVHGEMMSVAILAKQRALETIKASLARAMNAEADARELARLRAEDDERKARLEREEQAAREKADAEAKAKADSDRRERDEAEAKAREERALEAARADEQRKAREALERAEAEKQAILDGIAERERLARQLAEREANEKAAREADRKHRGKIMGEAKAALIELSVTEDAAKKIVLAIVAGEIPHVTLRF